MSRIIAAAVMLVAVAALGGCVTVGCDFLRQQATVTYTHPPKTDGYKK